MSGIGSGHPRQRRVSGVGVGRQGSGIDGGRQTREFPPASTLFPRPVKVEPAMDLVGDLVNRAATSRRPALRTDGRVYSHADLSATARKATYCFGYLGAGGGETVEIDPRTVL